MADKDQRAGKPLRLVGLCAGLVLTIGSGTAVQAKPAEGHAAAKRGRGLSSGIVRSTSRVWAMTIQMS